MLTDRLCRRSLSKKINLNESLAQDIRRSSHPEVFLGKGVLKICSKFTGEHQCRSVISFALWHGCSPVNLLHIFRAPFLENLRVIASVLGTEISGYE